MSALASHERDPLLSTPTDIPSEDASDEVLPYKRTLAGFLCYSAAAESFSIVSVALFLPICLESFARENGFLAPDHQQNCHSLPTEPHSDRACDVRLLGQWVRTSSGRFMFRAC